MHSPLKRGNLPTFKRFPVLAKNDLSAVGAATFLLQKLETHRCRPSKTHSFV